MSVALIVVTRVEEKCFIRVIAELENIVVKISEQYLIPVYTEPFLHNGFCIICSSD